MVQEIKFSFLKTMKQYYVNRPWGRPRVDYTTIDQAYEDPSLTKKEAFKEKITRGHISGLINLGLGGLFAFFAKRIENSFWKGLWGFFSVLEIISAGISASVGTFAKDEKDEEMKAIIQKYVEKEPAPSFDLNRVILAQKNRDDVTTALSFTGERGVVINARGVIGNGKTMTGRAIAKTLESMHKVKANYWNAKEEAIQENLADQGVRFEFMGFKVGGETIGERVERIVANAVAHYRKTGEYVVVGLDEAHHLLGKDKHAWKFNSADPNARSEVSNTLGKIIQDKIQTAKCKGVVLVLMSNSTGIDLSAHLQRRFDADLVYDRPDKVLRQQLLPIVVNEELKNNQVNGVVLDGSDYAQLADIGTVNLLQRVFSGDNFNVPYDIKSCTEDLKSFNMLTYDAITKAVIAAVRAYKDSGTFSKQNLLAIVSEKLEDRVSTAVNDRSKWQDELKLKAGKDY